MEVFKRISKFRLVSSVFAASYALVLGGAAWSYFALKDISQPLILNYGLGVVREAGGNVLNLLAVGATAFVAVTINFSIALVFEERDWFWGKLLAAATLMLSLLLFIGFAAIISVN